MTLESFHHGGAPCGGWSGSFARINGKNECSGADALSNGDPDAVEAGDFTEAGNACGMKVRTQTLEGFLGSAGPLGSVEPEF